MIDFSAEGEYPLPELDFRLISSWLEAVINDHDLKLGVVNYLFCSEEYILEQNRKFLNHDFYTDVITFDYCMGDRVSGDIMISPDTVKSNAGELGEDPARELLRVIVHGVLHLCGINDKGSGEREIMEREENRALDMYFALS